MKTVRVTLELPSRFVRLLRSQITLSGIHNKDEMAPIELVGLLVCSEALGMAETQIAMSVPIQWRDSEYEPLVIHEERRVYER